MSGSRKINTRDLVNRIEKLTRERMMKSDVVSMDELRRAKKPTVPASILVVEDD